MSIHGSFKDLDASKVFICFSPVLCLSKSHRICIETQL